MAPPTFPIKGIQEDLGPLPGQTPLRQEIDAWSSDPKNQVQVALFMLALEAFQKIPYHDRLSYFQIAGIHGLPLVPWDEDTTTQTPGTTLGYCTHGSILFPAWHRPYVALFEQRLYEIMIEVIIPRFPPATHAALVAQAKAWRLPYWDWAAKKVDPNDPSAPPNYNLPQLVTQPGGRIFGPEGIEIEFPNPLNTFVADEPMGEYGIVDIGNAPYSICRATSRYPPPINQAGAKEAWTYGVQKNDQVRDALRGHQWYEGAQYTDTLGEAVYHLFSQKYFSSYDAFSSTRYTHGMPPPDYLSLEDIHNNIHNWTGGPGLTPSDDGGHMCEIGVAAFDPIFWLHHCNVDRQFAIWQALNDEAWFSEPSQQLSDLGGNWSTKPKTIVTPATALAPFHSDTKATYYDSNTVREWRAFGYSYPELQPWLPKYFKNGVFVKAAYLKDISEQVNALYNVTRTDILRLHDAIGVADKAVEDEDWIVNVQYERFALDGASFTVHIFIGKNKVGQVYNFCAPGGTVGGSGGCVNCQAQQEASAISTGQVHITSALLRDVKSSTSKLSQFQAEHIAAYLAEGLSWKVTNNRGREVPLEALPSLRVSVAKGKGIHYTNNTILSRYHEYEVLPEITDGRLGGLARGDF